MKEPLTFEEQVEKLRDHNIVVPDAEFALMCLKNINYYHLRGYWLSFEENNQIKDGTTFNNIWDAYLLDTELKALLFQYILPIESKLKTQLTQLLTYNYGPYAYENIELFSNEQRFRKANNDINNEIERAKKRKERFVMHNINKYGKLPMWACIELITFGGISLIYQNLNPNVKTNSRSNKSIKAEIASQYGTTPYYLESWLRHLCYVRNLCAHQSRFYNNSILIPPKLRNTEKKYKKSKQLTTFIILKNIYNAEWNESWKDFLLDLTDVFKKYPKVSLQPMGFPNNWLEILSE